MSTFFLFAPVFNFVKLPVNVRILFAFALSVFFSQLLPSPIVYDGSTAKFVGYVVLELINGAALSFGMLTAFAVFHFAGRILDFQMGFGVAGLIDPATQVQAPMIGTVLNLVAVIVFIAAGGAHLVFTTLFYSFTAVPPGSAFNLQTVWYFLIQAGLIFTMSLTLVAPVMIAIFMLDVVMAVAGRLMPQMNVFIISIPAKIAVGLAIIAATLVHASPFFNKVFMSIFKFWEPLING